MRINLLLIMLCVSSVIKGQLFPQTISIPMRDGNALAADLYLPATQGVFPVVLIQTPYNKHTFRLGLPLNVGQEIGGSPFAFVVLDWRCFFQSAAACTSSLNRGEDGYDAVEWIAQQPWSNGMVATWGLSALGNIQFMTAREHPPHLVCGVPIVYSPNFRYQQYFPGGVALPEYIGTLASYYGDAFNLIAQNPYYNLAWQYTESSTFYPDEIEIPMLHVGGWFDHNTEDVLLWFNALRTSSPAADGQWLLMGPWTHSGTFGTVMQGELSYPDAVTTNHTSARKFLEYYLLGANNGWDETPRVTYYQSGANTWLESETFPPALETQHLSYFLRDDFSLSPDSLGVGQVLGFSFDPMDPSPTIGGKTLSPDLDQGPYDQQPAEVRGDNLVFTTAILEQDMVVRGQVQVVLHVSSDRPDTDIDLRLTDVYPDGRSMAFGQIAQRMRFREGYTQNDEVLMTEGEVFRVAMAFDHLAHTFEAGHAIRLVVTSSNYPQYNRNMNTGGEMYPEGNLDTLVSPEIANNSVHVLGSYLSRITLPLQSMTSSDMAVLTPPAVWITPNPANTEFIVNAIDQGCTLHVLDISGRTMARILAPGDQVTIDTHLLPEGLYIVVIRCVGDTRSAKVLVHHP